MCECYQIGGRFTAEDPDCPEHGTEAQKRPVMRLDDGLPVDAVRNAGEVCQPQGLWFDAFGAKTARVPTAWRSSVLGRRYR